MAILPGKRLGPYEILSAIGAGGMGEVYRAKDIRLDRTVAIKILPEAFAHDSERLSRFQREAKMLAALNDPNIVTIYDIGWADTIPYIAMELVNGSTVRELLRSGPMLMRQVLEGMTQIAEGLSKAHEAGMVHRDLKPENVMVTANGLVKILDFGLGKHETSSFLRASSDGTTIGVVAPVTIEERILGTVEYMSPEQAAGRPVDFRSDQFSLGSLLCEMATGTSPFRRDTVVQTLSAIIEAPPQLSKSPPVPEGLGRILDRCLQKDPEKRYPSTRMLATELRSLTTLPIVGDGGVKPAAPVPATPLLSTKRVMVVVLMVLTFAGIVATVPSIRSLIVGGLGPAISVPAKQNTMPVPSQPSFVLPYWSLATLNFVVLVALAATLLALDHRSAAVRVFALVLILRGIVGVTATLGDGAPFVVARWAVPLDAACSTLFSGALTIFALLYPHRRPWAGRLALGATAFVTLLLAGVVFAVPSALGVFAVAPNRTLAVVSGGPLLSERAWYWGAGAMCAAILAVEHAQLARRELRRSVLLVGIALATFPIYVAATIIQLPPPISRAAFAAYGGAAGVALGLVAGAIALIAALVLAITELRHRDRRSAAGTLLACGIAGVSGIIGVRFGGVPTVAGSVSFVLRGVWRFPLPILATYALLRHQLLGIEVRLKWTIRRGTLAAIFLAVFLIVAQLIQNVANVRLGYLAGAIAMGSLLFALAPLQRLSERFADALLPGVRDPRAAPPARRLDAYKQAAELVLADGKLTPHKERALAALADELGIGVVDALEVRESALRRSW